MATPSSSPEARAEGSMFEALFVRSFPPTPATAEALRAVGYDVTRPEPTYSAETWREALAICARTAFPDDTAAAAHHKVGRAFTDSFLQTLSGRIVQAVMHLLRPETLMQRVPRYAQLGRKDALLELVKLEPGRCELAFNDPVGVPADFVAGTLERALELTGARPQVTVDQSDRQHARITYTW